MKTGIYQHYKGGFYQVLGIAAHSETDQLMVVYVSLNSAMPGPRMRVRPLTGPEGWNKNVSKLRGPDGLATPRFTYIGDEIA